MTDIPPLPRSARTLLLLTVVVFLILGIQALAYVVAMVAVSLILAMIAYPLTKALRAKGLPEAAAVGMVTIGACLAVLFVCYLVFYSFESLISSLPLYQHELTVRLAELLALMERIGISTGSFTPGSINLQHVAEFLSSFTTSLADELLRLFFIAIMTIFMLFEAPRIPERIRKITGDGGRYIEAFSRMSGYLTDFVIVRTEVNIIHGFLFGGFLWIMGVHSAVLWGVLTFLLSYIPYIGLIVAALPAIFFAWLQFGPWGMISVVAAVIVLNALVENPIFAHFASRRFDIPALLVIVSVIFWGWLLGIAGMVFAVPLTLIVLALIQLSGDWAWMNTILGVDHIFTGRQTPPAGERAVEAPPAR